MNLPLEVNKTSTLPPEFWIESAKPFVKSTKGVLVHRPRRCGVHKLGKRPFHLAVKNYCGMGFTGLAHIVFMEEPEDDQVVCAKCEDVAVEKGLPSSSSITGKHVCTGGVRSFKRCCDDQ